MANITLLEDSDEMRQTASAIETLKEDFESQRKTLKAAIEDELNTACKGDIADEFTKYYNDKIDTQLVAERERLEVLIGVIRKTADVFDQTGEVVKGSFY